MRVNDGVLDTIVASCCAIPVEVLSHDADVLGEVQQVGAPAGVAFEEA
jgi:hypothetical protein